MGIKACLPARRPPPPRATYANSGPPTVPVPPPQTPQPADTREIACAWIFFSDFSSSPFFPFFFFFLIVVLYLSIYPFFFSRFSVVQFCPAHRILAANAKRVRVEQRFGGIRGWVFFELSKNPWGLRGKKRGCKLILAWITIRIVLVWISCGLNCRWDVGAGRAMHGFYDLRKCLRKNWKCRAMRSILKESCIDDKVTSILVAFCWNCISYKEIYNAFGKDYISSIRTIFRTRCKISLLLCLFE